MYRYLMKEGALVVGQQSQPALQHKDFSSPGNCNLFCSLGMSTQHFIQHTSKEPSNTRLPWDTCDTNSISFPRNFSFSWACLEVISHVLVPPPGLMISTLQQFPLCLPAWRTSPAAATYFLPCSNSTSQLPFSFWRNSREFSVQMLSKYFYFAHIVYLIRNHYQLFSIELSLHFHAFAPNPLLFLNCIVYGNWLKI